MPICHTAIGVLWGCVACMKSVFLCTFAGPTEKPLHARFSALTSFPSQVVSTLPHQTCHIAPLDSTVFQFRSCALPTLSWALVLALPSESQSRLYPSHMSRLCRWMWMLPIFPRACVCLFYSVRNVHIVARCVCCVSSTPRIYICMYICDEDVVVVAVVVLLFIGYVTLSVSSKR